MTSKKNIKKLEKFLETERMHAIMYSHLAKEENHPKHKRFLNKLTMEEKKHEELLREILKDEGVKPGRSHFLWLKLAFYRSISAIFGVPFGIAVIEREEDQTIKEYIAALGQIKEKRSTDKLKTIIKDEEAGEQELQDNLNDYSEHFDYIKSIVFGLNDGLVEILAVVAGLAVVATAPFVVVVGGIIVGLSGTLSMAGGAYLSSKSYNLVEEEKKGTKASNSPFKDAAYTGIFYFLGSLSSIVPFAAGLSGFAGILAAIIIVSIVLILASAVIGIVSKTSIKRRSLEMLTISFGAAFVTIILGIILRAYGIAI
jgi:VIT1/CCC1 family predicted Fe2+/Mn2+ transporter